MSRLATLARRVGSAAVTAVEIAALVHEPAVCDCGRPVRNERAHACWQCRLDDDNHGTDYERDDQ